jgi:hypothetical protein
MCCAFANAINSPPVAAFRSRIRTNMPAGGANLKALAVALPLPRFIGQLFGFDRGALTENAIGKLAVAAPTLRRRDDAHAPGV